MLVTRSAGPGDGRKGITLRRTIYRLGGLLAASLLISTAVAGPSSAQTPERFVANAAGRALALRVLGNDLTFGVSTAAVEPLKAVATGQGQVLTPTDALTSSVTAEGSDAKAQKCGPISLPAEIAGVVNLSAACSGATLAEISNSLPRASGEGSVATLGLSANTILSQLPVGEVLDETLSPLLEQVDEATGLNAGTTVNDLVQNILTTKTLDVALGKATSDVTTTADSVTSKATASGATIKLLPTPEFVNSLGDVVTDPLATITVSSSSATATYNRSTGVATPSFDAALVTVKFNSALGLPTLSLKPGVTRTILEGTPLESTIVVADGSTSKTADGGVGAIADGVSLQLLKGVNGGLGLQLAHSEVNVAGKVATKVVEPPKPAPVVKAADTLPRTGGLPWMPMAGAGALGLAVLVRRTRLAQN